MRTEQLEEDLLSVLDLIPISAADREEVLRRRAIPTNPSPRRDYRFYYEADTMELVARLDRYLIEKHDYEFR